MVNNLKQLINNKSVAVIGNASSIIGSNHGKAIDKHDIVIRINKGVPIDSLCCDMGKRTDIWVYGGGDETYSIYNDKIKDAFNAKYVYGINECGKYLVSDTIGLDHFVAVNMLENIMGSKPSTGCIVLNLLIMLNNFSKLDIYGFDWFKSGDWSGNFEYPNRKSKTEDFINEEKYIRCQIKGNNKINIHGGNIMARKKNVTNIKNKAIQDNKAVKGNNDSKVKELERKINKQTEKKCICGKVSLVTDGKVTRCIDCQRMIN